MTTATQQLEQWTAARPVNPHCVACQNYRLWAGECGGYEGQARPVCCEEITTAGGGIDPETGDICQSAAGYETGGQVSPLLDRSPEAEDNPSAIPPVAGGPSVVLQHPVFRKIRQHNQAV